VFSDVPADHPFFSYVADMYEMGAISGYSDGSFRPNNTATRAHVAKMAVLVSGISMEGITSGEQHFTDVDQSNPFFAYIEAAYANGWVSGYSDGTFRPGANVTRGQIVKIAVQAAGFDLDLHDPSSATFTDVEVGSTYFVYVETAYANGILSGYSDGSFRPNAHATRGQLSKILDLSSHFHE
jgi:hypothetical protein